MSGAWAVGFDRHCADHLLSAEEEDAKESGAPRRKKALPAANRWLGGLRAAGQLLPIRQLHRRAGLLPVSAPMRKRC